MDGGHILLPKISIYKNRTKQTDQNMSELKSKSFGYKLHKKNLKKIISFSILNHFS